MVQTLQTNIDSVECEEQKASRRGFSTVRARCILLLVFMLFGGPIPAPAGVGNVPPGLTAISAAAGFSSVSPECVFAAGKAASPSGGGALFRSVSPLIGTPERGGAFVKNVSPLIGTSERGGASFYGASPLIGKPEAGRPAILRVADSPSGADSSASSAAGKAAAEPGESPPVNPVTAGKAAAASDGGGGVRVTLRGLDAELANEVARLREERSKLQDEVRELELRCRALSEERDGLHRELIEALQIIAAQNEKLLRWQSGVAGLFDADGVDASGGEDARILAILRNVSSSGSDLAVAVAEFCREMESSLDRWQLPQAEKAGVRVRMNQLRSLSGQFSALNDWETMPVGLNGARILAVDRNLGAVILPVGTASGTFNGLVCSVPAAPGVKLKIVAVRRFVSAAVVTAGDPASIAVGMEVVAKANAKTEEN